MTSSETKKKKNINPHANERRSDDKTPETAEKCLFTFCSLMMMITMLLFPFPYFGQFCNLAFPFHAPTACAPLPLGRHLLLLVEQLGSCDDS